VLDRPATGRIFFEQVIRDNLDLGRPDRVGLVFDRRIVTRGRRATPGPFRTRVLTAGVTPSLHIDYKHSKVKQYHKLDQALRTETTINDSRDFGIGKRLGNLPALREVGFAANRRLLAVQRLSHDPTLGADAIDALTSPTVTTTGTRIPALPFDSRRTQALLAALVIFRLLPHGFRNRDLRAHLAPLHGIPAQTMTPGQLSYDLRRLRHHGLIERIPGTHRYNVTDHGLHLAAFLTRIHTRLLHGGLSDILDHAAVPTPLRRHLDRLTTVVNDYARAQKLAA
jgi:hypothetical protein